MVEQKKQLNLNKRNDRMLCYTVITLHYKEMLKMPWRGGTSDWKCEGCGFDLHLGSHYF